jgi:amino acid efflux transporter
VTQKTQHGHLGLAQGTALYVASVLGSGILVLPGLSAAVAGPASIVSVALMVVLTIPVAATFGALAARYPDSGGVASYVRKSMGNTFARMTGYWFYFGVSTGLPIVSVMGAEYIVAVLGLSRSAMLPIVLVLYVAPFALNLLGVRLAGWVQFVLTALMMIVVVLVASVGAPAVNPENFTPFMPNGLVGVGQAMLLLMWAFAGWEVGTHIAAEFKDPRRIIPIATGLALVLTGVAYLVTQWVTIGVLGDQAGVGSVPLLNLVNSASPGVGGTVIAVIAGVMSFGVVNAYFAGAGKLGSALGRDGDLPKFMAKGSEPDAVPRRSLIIMFIISSGSLTLMTFNDFRIDTILTLQISGMVCVYVVGMIAATRIFERWTRPWWVAVISVPLTAMLLIFAGANLLFPLAGVIGAVTVSLVKRIRSRRSSRVSDL